MLRIQANRLSGSTGVAWTPDSIRSMASLLTLRRRAAAWARSLFNKEVRTGSENIGRDETQPQHDYDGSGGPGPLGCGPIGDPGHLHDRTELPVLVAVSGGPPGSVHRPGAARFILQPTVAMFLGLRGGVADARARRPPYVMGLLFDPLHRPEYFRTGLAAVRDLVAIGIILECGCAVLDLPAGPPWRRALRRPRPHRSAVCLCAGTNQSCDSDDRMTNDQFPMTNWKKALLEG